MKKNCNIIKDLIPLYIDNCCSKETKELVEEHLKNCQNCTKLLNDLKVNVQIAAKQEINIMQKFMKKMNFKIIKNSILITGIFLTIMLVVGYFSNNYEFKMDYNKDIKVLLLQNNRNWNFQFMSPMSGKIKAFVLPYQDNGKIINRIFVTQKYTIQDYWHTKKGDGGITSPNIDYQNININDKLEVYYTTEDFNKIKTASQEELNSIISNATLIFDNATETKTMNCTLNDQKYQYTLTYYKINKQIISSYGDNTLPDELLNNIISIDGEYKSLWYGFDNADDTFTKFEKYISNHGGKCSIN